MGLDSYPLDLNLRVPVCSETVRELGTEKKAPPLPIGDRIGVVLLATFTILTIDGLVLALAGPGALLPVGGPFTQLPLLLLIGGAIGALVTFLTCRRTLVATIRLTVPRLYPLAPTWVHVLLYVSILVGAVAVFLGLFDIFSAAHSNGNTAQISDPNAANLLIGVGSLLVWTLALYATLVVLRSIRMGQLIAARKGADVYGAHVATETPEPVRLLRGAHLSPPRPEGSRTVLYVVSIVFLLGMSAAVQALEVNSNPAPPIAWAWAELFLPMWGALIAGGIWLVDTGIRSLERNYVAVVGRTSVPAPIVSDLTPPT
ncbi:MAG: hypothetical protein WB778_01575 [Thermoplasmata archaeon]